MVIMASGIARGRGRTTTTTESRNKAAILTAIAELLRAEGTRVDMPQVDLVNFRVEYVPSGRF